MPSEWQPIQTAPKDGTRILVAFTLKAGASAGKQFVTESAWQSAGYWEGFQRPDQADVTHWMPLPDPPLAGEATHE